MENGAIRVMHDAYIPQFYQIIRLSVSEEYCGGSFPIRTALELIIKYLLHYVPVNSFSSFCSATGTRTRLRKLEVGSLSSSGREKYAKYFK